MMKPGLMLSLPTLPSDDDEEEDVESHDHDINFTNTGRNNVTDEPDDDDDMMMNADFEFGGILVREQTNKQTNKQLREAVHVVYSHAQSILAH
jgi:hypothetical protein